MIVKTGKGPLTYDVRMGNEDMPRHVDHLLTNKTNKKTEESNNEQSEALEKRLDDALNPADCGPKVQPAVIAPPLLVKEPARALPSEPKPVRAPPPFLVPAPAPPPAV